MRCSWAHGVLSTDWPGGPEVLQPHAFNQYICMNQLAQTLTDHVAPNLPRDAVATMRVVATKVSAHAPVFDSEVCVSREWLVTCAWTRSNVMAAAMTVHEFWSGARHCLYVEKLDSTGLGGSDDAAHTSLARLVATPVVEHLVSTGTEVFVYARSQPEYLFPNSAANPRKTALGDKELTACWMKALAAVRGSTTRVYFIPDATEQTMKSTPRLARSSQGWEWGFFAPADKLAHKVLPKFPDDAKGRLLKEYKDDMTVGEFWELAGVSHDCKRAGFLYMVASKERRGDDAGECGDGDEGVGVDDMMRVRSLLDTLSFSVADAAASTAKLNELLDSLHAKQVVVKSTAKETVAPEDAPPEDAPPAHAQPVNVVQGLIKRKSARAPDPASKRQKQQL